MPLMGKFYGVRYSLRCEIVRGASNSVPATHCHRATLPHSRNVLVFGKVDAESELAVHVCFQASAMRTLSEARVR